MFRNLHLDMFLDNWIHLLIVISFTHCWHVLKDIYMPRQNSVLRKRLQTGEQLIHCPRKNRKSKWECKKTIHINFVYCALLIKRLKFLKGELFFLFQAVDTKSRLILFYQTRTSYRSYSYWSILSLEYILMR